MSDVVFGDLDGPSKAPAKKAPRFAPKGSKPKREPEAQVPSSESKPAVVPKVELDDSKPPPVATVYAKTEIGKPSHTNSPSDDPNGNLKLDAGATEMEVDNGNVKLDTDATEMEVNNDQLEDGKDQVVREIDVFFNSSSDPNSKLYVLQYPLRQRWRPYELDRCEKVRLKPTTAEVEVELSVQANSENFDRDTADDKAMKKQVLSTSWKPSLANGYAVGILIGNELHLNPVNAVVQLRPSMQHIKPSLKNMNITHDDDDMIDSEDIKDVKPIKQPKKQTKVPVANEQTEDIKEEEWISLKYHGEGSKLSHTCMDKMVERQDSEIQFAMSQSDYIDSLCPAPAPGVKPKRPSLTALLQMPLEERYKAKLLEGPAVRFNVLKHIAPDSNTAEMFEVLQNHAHLVQGLWVAKSKLKYGKDEGKELLLRNYTMLRFSQNPIFPEKHLPKSNAVIEILKTILDEFGGRRDSFRDWKFREDTDDSFIKEYPYIVEEQKKIWDRAEPQIVGMLFPANPKHPIRDSRSNLNNKNNNNNNNKNNVETKTGVVPPSKGVMLDETREALPKALQKLFQTYKVCSLNQIRNRLRDMALSENTQRKGTREARAAAAAADAPQEELLKTLNQVAVDIHGVYVSKSSPDLPPQSDDFRNVVIDLLRAEGPKARLKRASIEEAAKLKLNRIPSNTEFQKVLTEICTFQSSAWVLRSGDGSPT